MLRYPYFTASIVIGVIFVSTESLAISIGGTKSLPDFEPTELLLSECCDGSAIGTGFYYARPKGINFVGGPIPYTVDYESFFVGEPELQYSSSAGVGPTGSASATVSISAVHLPSSLLSLSLGLILLGRAGGFWRQRFSF